MSDSRMTDAEFRRAVHALVADHGEPREPVRRETFVEIAAILLADPNISANAVAAQVPARRSDVLKVVRAIRERAALVPGPGNQPRGEVRS